MPFRKFPNESHFSKFQNAANLGGSSNLPWKRDTAIYKQTSYVRRRLSRARRVRGPKILKISPQMFRTKFVHTSGKMFDFRGGGRLFSIWGVENIFNPCSHIELNTPNPNPVFKITICFTKTQTMPKHFRNIGNIFRKIKIIICIMYKLYNSYFVIFVNCVNFVIWGFLYLYILRIGLLHV